MQETRLTFLEALSKGDRQAWKSFDLSYKPLLIRWMRKYTMSEAQAKDITQEVMIFLFENINNFQHNAYKGAFRSWLRQTTVNITRNYLRKQTTNNNEVLDEKYEEMLEQLVDSNSDLSQIFDNEHKQAMISTLLDNVSKYFQEKTITIFKQHLLEGMAAEEIAKNHNISKQQVYIVRSRVLRRLREMNIDWIEDMLYDR